MFVLSNLQIRTLKMHAEKPLSIIRLCEVLTKGVVNKLEFENAKVSRKGETYWHRKLVVATACMQIV